MIRPHFRKIPNNTKTSEDHSDPLLQVILSLSTGAIKDAFYHIGGNIGEFSNQKKRTVAVEILRKWGRIIVGIGACVFFKQCSLTHGGGGLWKVVREFCENKIRSWSKYSSTYM